MNDTLKRDAMLLNTADPAAEDYMPETDFNGVLRDGVVTNMRFG